MVESALLSLNGEAQILRPVRPLTGDNAPPMSPPTALMSLLTLPGLLGVSAGGGDLNMSVHGVQEHALVGRSGGVGHGDGGKFSHGRNRTYGGTKTHRFSMDYANEL
jgi:hypothetical protein